MTTDELNAIVQAVMTEMEKAGVDFDFKAETPQADDLVYVMRGTADSYQGITVTWQNLLDIIVKKATDAKDEAVSAKEIALQTLATIQGIESNIGSMKSSVETTKGEVETLKSDVSAMKASVETSEANVTQMKSDVSEMKTSIEGTKTEVEGLKSDVTNLKAQTQTIVDNAKDEVTGLLDTKADVTYVDGELAKKVNYTDSLSYEEIMATTPAISLDVAVPKASAVKYIDTVLSTKLYYVGDLVSIANIKEWVVENKPSVPWVAYAGSDANSVVLGTPFNRYSNGYVGFIYFGYFSSSIKIYKFNDGSWNE